MSKHPRDRFDDAPRAAGRIGAHRAETPGMNGWVVLLWSAAVALVLIVVGIFVALVLMGRITWFGAAEQTPPEPTVTAVVDTDYRVMILNATPDDTADDSIVETLLSNGWSESSVVSSAGSTQDFAKTTIYYVESGDEAAALGVADLLGGAVVEQSDHYAGLNTTDSPQLTVVVGLDRLPGAPATPEE